MRYLKSFLFGVFNVVYIATFVVLTIVLGVSINLISNLIRIDPSDRSQVGILIASAVISIVVTAFIGPPLWQKILGKQKLAGGSTQVIAVQDPISPEIVHDTEIFIETEKILSESQLDELFTAVYNGEFELRQRKRADALIDFAKLGGNTYLNSTLQDNFKAYKEELEILRDNMLGFSPVNRDGPVTDWTRYMVEPWNRSNPDPDKDDRWHKLQKETAAQVKKTEAKFKEYRALIKQTLFI